MRQDGGLVSLTSRTTFSPGFAGVFISGEQKMEFLYNWCFQMSEVVQELRATTQTLMDKIILVEALLVERTLPTSGEPSQ